MKIHLIFYALFFFLGGYLGSTHEKSIYEDELRQIHTQYVESIQEARAKENEWREKADALELKYQKELEAVKSSNTDVIDKLRKQLSNSSSRMPQTCQSTSKSNDSARRARVSEELTNLINFSERCSKRLDESLVLNKALQTWIKENTRNYQ